MIRFKLKDIFQGGIERIVRCSDPQRPGGEINKRKTFLPGKVYRLSDPIAIDYIKGNIGDVNEMMVLTDDAKANLAYHKIDYTIKKCGTCSNAKPKASFNPFVILEDTDEK